MRLETALKYTRQNTGAHFLDSGGAYGRHYNDPTPSGLIRYDEHCGPILSLTHWLVEFAEIHDLHAQLYRWAKREENRESSWFDVGREFMAEKGYWDRDWETVR